MAGLFLLFVMTVAFSEMLSGYLKAGSDTQEWVNTPKK